MTETLIVDVRAGLGNRLQALISGICMAQDMGRNLQVIWTPEEDCIATFQNLFQKDCFPPWVKINMVHCLTPSIKLTTQEDADSYIQRKSTQPILSYSRFYVRNEDIWMNWARRLMPAVDLPTLPIISGGKRVGIHIRRGDHTESTTRSPLQLFLEVMLREPESTVFIVASDDLGVKIAIQELFGYRAFFPASVLSRRSLKGIQDAVKDMFSLAMCDMIYGSSDLSFGDLAAMLGDVPLHVLTCV